MYKAKNLITKEWVKGYLLKTNEGTYICLANQRDDDLFTYPEQCIILVDENTVCSAKNITDKNNKKAKGERKKAEVFLTVFHHLLASGEEMLYIKIRLYCGINFVISAPEKKRVFNYTLLNFYEKFIINRCIINITDILL